jgi:hypothetical protein
MRDTTTAITRTMATIVMREFEPKRVSMVSFQSRTGAGFQPGQHI